MTGLALVAVASGAGAGLLCTGPPHPGGRVQRLAGGRSRGPVAAGADRGRDSELSATARRLAVVAAAIATGVTLSGPIGWVLAAVVGVGVHVWISRRGDRVAAARAAALRRSLPLALDLIAAALSSGTTVGAAVELAAQGVGQPLDRVLVEVVTALRLGAGPDEAWRGVLSEPAVQSLGRLAVRSAESGAAMASACRELSGHSRDALVVEARVAIGRAGVLCVLPLALCFLPAFVLVGIVPVVVGLLRSLSL